MMYQLTLYPNKDLIKYAVSKEFCIGTYTLHNRFIDCERLKRFPHPNNNHNMNLLLSEMLRTVVAHWSIGNCNIGYYRSVAYPKYFIACEEV
jgi:hypothetical protein